MINATLNDITSAVGLNWSGIDIGRRPPTGPELATLAGKGATLVRIIVAWDTPTSVIHNILSLADIVGPYIGVEMHSYIILPDGTRLTPTNTKAWTDRAVADLKEYGSHPSYIPLDMNEPNYSGSDWEIISKARVDALKAYGYQGVIGVCAGQQSSAAGINTIHPNGWWLKNYTNCFLEVHHYMAGLIGRQSSTGAKYNGDTRDAEGQKLFTRSAMDAWAKQQNLGSSVTDYLTFVKKAINFGILGSLDKWGSVPTLIGEFAMMPEGFQDVLEFIWQTYQDKGVGALQWGTGDWTTGYPWNMTNKQFQTMNKFANGRL